MHRARWIGSELTVGGIPLFVVEPPSLLESKVAGGVARKVRRSQCGIIVWVSGGMSPPPGLFMQDGGVEDGGAWTLR